jgi:hypothetical protein
VEYVFSAYILLELKIFEKDKMIKSNNSKEYERKKSKAVERIEEEN